MHPPLRRSHSRLSPRWALALLALLALVVAVQFSRPEHADAAGSTFSVQSTVASGVEGSIINIVVQRDTAGATGDVTFSLTPSGANQAVAPTDYTAPGSLTLAFAVGQFTRTLALQTVFNPLLPDRTLTFALTSASVGDFVHATVNTTAVTITQAPPPTVSSINPSIGLIAGGTLVTVSGSNLGGASIVTIGGSACNGIANNSTTSLQCTTTAHAIGPASVLVTTPSGTNGANTLFTYVTSTSSQFSFSAATYNTTEGATLSVTVVRSGLLTQDAGVTLTFSNGTAAYGTDFQPQGGSPSLGLTFGGTTSQTQATVLVNILSNSLSTSDTQFTMTLTAGGTNTVVAPFTATVNINDIHGPQTPSVTNLSQHSGPTGGGNQVVISGVHFTGVICPSGVLFGGQPATACTVNSDASITATAPAGSGTVNVRVTNLAGPSPDAGAADDYTYGAGPVVTSLSPNNGPASGGNTVVLSGTGFGSSPTVRFNGVVATIVGTATNTSITVFAPANSAGTVASVIVTASAVQSPDVPESRYTYNTGTGTGVPAISTISPASGTTLGGTPVTISGTNLTGTTGVTFDGLAASLQAVTAAAVNVLTPAHAAGAVNVVLLNPNGNVTRNSAYQFTTGPTVTGLSPRGVSLNADATVQITGTGFVSGATTVQFGSTNIPAGSVTFISAQQISVQAPQSTIVTTVDVRVTTAAGQSPNTPDDDFSYGSSSPGVTAISPNSGPTSGGNIVTVNGLNFIGTVTVQFGLGNFGTEVTLVNAGQLTVKAPGRALGTVSLFVTTNAGTSADTAADDYTYTNAPSITSLSPTSGLPGATTLVDITGTNLLGATSVKFGTVAAETYTVLSNVLIRVAVPGNLVAGIYDVTVTGPGGISAVSAQTKFTVGGSGPAVTSLSPNTAPINNSTTTVAITGVNFAAPATVSFGGVAATNVVVVNSTRITVTAPSRSTNGTVDVIVSTTAGSSPGAGTGNDFTYGSTQTATYTLSFRWTLITWTGRANIGIAQALQGLETPDNAATNNVTSQVTAVFKWSPNGAGCGAGQLTCWLAYFPAGTGVPGANDISTLENGTAYWIAVVANVSWTVISGP